MKNCLHSSFALIAIDNIIVKQKEIVERFISPFQFFFLHVAPALFPMIFSFCSLIEIPYVLVGHFGNGIVKKHSSNAWFNHANHGIVENIMIWILRSKCFKMISRDKASFKELSMVSKSI